LVNQANKLLARDNENEGRTVGNNGRNEMDLREGKNESETRPGGADIDFQEIPTCCDFATRHPFKLSWHAEKFFDHIGRKELEPNGQPDGFTAPLENINELTVMKPDRLKVVGASRGENRPGRPYLLGKPNQDSASDALCSRPGDEQSLLDHTVTLSDTCGVKNTTETRISARISDRSKHVTEPIVPDIKTPLGGALGELESDSEKAR
jgi:hypothetical protein